MNLQRLSDQELLARTRELARKERELLSEVLHPLKEVERRRLFADLKYKSLFEYCVRELHYSEDQAYRRIQAMRLMKELPQLEEKIKEGSLTLSTLGVAGSWFKNQSLSSEKKLEVVESLSGKSRREAERELGKSKPSEHELRVVASKELLNKIERVRPKKTAPPRKAASDTGSRYISAQIRRHIWRQDHGHCQNCGSSHALQIEHIIPFAKGGKPTTENLKLLCRSCNQRAAIREFGPNKMQAYLVSK